MIDTLTTVARTVIPESQHEYRYSQPQHIETNSRKTVYAAHIWRDGELVKVVSAPSRRVCSVEVRNWIYRDQHPGTPPAPFAETGDPIAERDATRRAARRARREWVEAV